MGIVWQSIFFLFCFSALRKYAGGYHADTPIRCYFLSFITLFIALMGIKILQCDDNVGILIQTINLLIIIFLSPIDSVVHRLEYEEKKEYGTRAKKIALIYYVLYCILKKASIVYISTPIAVACSMVGISLIGGYITQTSHIKNGICSLKNQYFSSQNSAQAAAEPHSNAFCMYFGSR